MTRFTFAIVVCLWAVVDLPKAVAQDSRALLTFQIPDSWQKKFWSEPGTLELLDLDSKAVAALVPEQAGLKYCRCPKCGAADQTDPLIWRVAQPTRLKCRTCSTSLPDEKIPAKVGDKIPEEIVEVFPRKFHRYPYHVIDSEKANYPDERVFIAAKRDYEAREYLAKAAMYAALRYRDSKPATRDPRLARFACAILLRFAQVYPSYATHYDRPGAPKFFDRADLAPPFRRSYGTAKWDSSGALDVPLNLAITYAILRGNPALHEAGVALADPHPNHTIEEDLFRASARFVKAQPEDASEISILACRGMFAVGRLLNDPEIIQSASERLDTILTQAFYHDGTWRSGDAAAQHRVVSQLDGWIGRLLADGPSTVPKADHAIIGLARASRDAAWISSRSDEAEVLLASWPGSSSKLEPRRSALLGGAGIARLGVGQGNDALDLELRGLGDLGAIPSGRLAFRVAVGGIPILGDLDGDSPSGWGFEYSTASKSGLVVVDGLNQRESIESIREPSPGSDIRFYATDPDFQVASFDDRYAYPKSTKRYRHTVVAASLGKSRYAVSVVEVDGGLQHDQIFQGSVGQSRWEPSVALNPGPATLLPERLPFVPNAKPEDGRWFVQAMGGFHDLNHANLDHPTQALLIAKDRPGVRLHFLGDTSMSMIEGRSVGKSAEGRAAILLRRRSEDGAALSTTFVTVIEPLGRMPGLKRVGRVAGPPGVITIAVETSEGTDYLSINSAPGELREIPLPDGRSLSMDGLAARVGPSGLTLAGGTHAEIGDRHVELAKLSGTIVAAGQSTHAGAIGVFRVSAPLPATENLAGRTLLIRHGDGSSRGWTIVAVENIEDGARIHVREEAGLRIDPATTSAKYERFPGIVVPGPHRFGISRIAR